MGTPFQAQFNAQAKLDKTRGNTAQDAYLNDLLGYDATSAADKTAQGMWNQFATNLETELPKLRGSEGAAGRLGSGWGYQDEDQWVRQGEDSVANAIAQNALQAQGLNLQAYNSLGNYGNAATNRYLDVLTGMRDTQEAQDARANSLWGSLLGSAGKVGSALIMHGA